MRSVVGVVVNWPKWIKAGAGNCAKPAPMAAPLRCLHGPRELLRGHSGRLAFRDALIHHCCTLPKDQCSFRRAFDKQLHRHHTSSSVCIAYSPRYPSRPLNTSPRRAPSNPWIQTQQFHGFIAHLRTTFLSPPLSLLTSLSRRFSIQPA